MNTLKAVLANDLITGNMSLTEVEHNTFMLLVSTIRGTEVMEATTWYEFPLDLYGKLAGVSRDAAYHATKIASEHLFKRTCILKEGNLITRINLLTAIRFNQENGTIEATFHPELFPYISELVNRFTYIDVSESFLIKKPQLKNLYNVLSTDRWNKRLQGREYSLEELYKMLDVPASYRNYKEFNKHILGKGIREFGRLGLGKLKVKQVKEGRSTVGVKLEMEWQEGTKEREKKEEIKGILEKAYGKDI